MEEPVLSSQIQILLRNGTQIQHLTLDFTKHDSIGVIKDRLFRKTGIPISLMKIIFCGRQLDETTNLESLSLGPQTNLTVCVDHKKNNLLNSLSTEPKTSNNTNYSAYSTFHVFCKKCDMLQRGKLRAYCSNCNSTSIQFKNEPQGWEDVLKKGKLNVECNECEETDQTALILFKCVVSLPLTQIKQNKQAECVICTEISPLVWILDCKHSSCLECFIAYAKSLLTQMNLAWKPQVGFTVACPILDCPNYVTDVHHFYLLGMETYQRYQRLAAQMYFAQQNERQYCPSCNAAFFLEEILENDENTLDEKMILCPECSKIFCRYCKTQNGCKCDEEVEKDPSEEFIELISRPCPNCKSPTERNGGCAHIHCTQCQTDWYICFILFIFFRCFICYDFWTNNCQSDHWFE